MQSTSSVIQDLLLWRGKVVNWLKPFNTFCFLDSSSSEHKGNSYDFIAGVGVKRAFSSSDKNALAYFKQFLSEGKKNWLFGHIGYELTTSDAIIRQAKDDFLQFPDIGFFEPEIVISLKNNQLQIFADQSEALFEEIKNTPSFETTAPHPQLSIQSRTHRNKYLDIIRQLQHHIHRGDCYEINFCQEFYAQNAVVHPFDLYQTLNRISPTPFSAFYRLKDKWLLCASPERFLQKSGSKIISQPIKGTLARKGHSTEHLQQERRQLLNNSKEKAENVMVVDLVRNDLSRICKEGTVQVEELFGIYSFAQVHQMISTISCQLEDGIGFTDIIDAMFPMGSMTGAPKIKVMNLIEKYEAGRRGIYSGSIGYISPTGDFDFNVVIRSIVYNASNQYLSWHAGSGITIYSNPQKEWDECKVKAAAIERVLSG